jgi:hypothetical protein
MKYLCVNLRSFEWRNDKNLRNKSSKTSKLFWQFSMCWDSTEVKLGSELLITKLENQTQRTFVNSWVLNFFFLHFRRQHSSDISKKHFFWLQKYLPLCFMHQFSVVFSVKKVIFTFRARFMWETIRFYFVISPKCTFLNVSIDCFMSFWPFLSSFFIA